MTYTAQDRMRVKDAQYRRGYVLRKYHGIPTSLIPAQPARDHITQLIDLGWSSKALAAMTTGITGATINNLRHGKFPTIERATANAVLAIPNTVAPNTAVHDTALIPTLGAERRVHALMTLGWNHDAMRPHAGNTTHIARGTYQQMLASRWRAVDTMYRQLSMQPGPSPTTARRAAASGWVSPLAWDDIDDPAESPTLGGLDGDLDPVVVDRIIAGEHIPNPTRAERIEVIRRWLADGRSITSLGRMTGWKVERYYRAGDAA